MIRLRPTCANELRSYLGVANQLNRIIFKLASICEKRRKMGKVNSKHRANTIKTKLVSNKLKMNEVSLNIKIKKGSGASIMSIGTKSHLSKEKAVKPISQSESGKTKARELQVSVVVLLLTNCQVIVKL